MKSTPLFCFCYSVGRTVEFVSLHELPYKLLLKEIMSTANRLFILVAFVCVAFQGVIFAQSPQAVSEDYLSWDLGQAERIGKSTREKGRAGGLFDLRVISTNKAINYSVRATLMSPEVIRASARINQLKQRLSVEETRKIVHDAEAAGDIVVMIEINPNEGSGVIPLDWRVFLQPKGLAPGQPGAIAGIKSPHLKKVSALSGLYSRNYEYDVFWVTFPLVDENKEPLLPTDVSDIQLVVGIYSSEARISWKVSDSIRQRIKSLSRK